MKNLFALPFLICALCFLTPTTAKAGPEPVDFDTGAVVDDIVESIWAISLFTHYDQTSSGLLEGWGGGVDLGYLYNDNLSFHLNYAWTDGTNEASFDRHTFLGLAKYSFGEGPLVPYVRGGGGFENAAGSNNVLVGAGAGLDVYLTDTFTVYAGADYYWSADTPDLTRFSIGGRYHFDSLLDFGSWFRE